MEKRITVWAIVKGLSITNLTGYFVYNEVVNFKYPAIIRPSGLMSLKFDLQRCFTNSSPTGEAEDTKY